MRSDCPPRPVSPWRSCCRAERGGATQSWPSCWLLLGLPRSRLLNGDPDARGEGSDVHTLRVPEITRLQEAYVDKVVATVGDLDQVLWEISNESPQESIPWQYHLIHYLRSIDPNRHPIGMTATFPGNRNEDLFRGPADWISPGNQGGWRKNPPQADGRKVVIVDTDHLWGIGGDAEWVRKVFRAGHHLAYMDPLDEDKEREEARVAMRDRPTNLYP
jgi:hypothetical protein